MSLHLERWDTLSATLALTLDPTRVNVTNDPTFRRSLALVAPPTAAPARETRAVR
jgi:hypothetical protein